MKLVLILLALTSASCLAADPEVRGTWLTTTANTAIASPENTAASMAQLREMGLNTVYVECWKNGYTEFPSQVLKRSIGIEMKVNPSVKGTPAIQRDLLAECLLEAHRNQMLCIAWFEYGFMAAYKDTHNELRARRDWLSLDQHGNDVAKNGFVWLNPLHPDAQDLLIGIVVEAVKNYDLDGIQLDDRIVWPGLEMGYDEYTKKLYAQEHKGKEPPLDIHDKEWCDWRRAKVEAFSKRFVAAVRKANPDLIISLSPGPHPWALENYLIDWPAWRKWTDSSTWDEYVPQCYRMNYEAFEKSWMEQVDAMGDGTKRMIAGIRLVGDGPDLPPDDVAKSVELVRKTGGEGHCWWFSRGVLEVFSREIAAIYDVKKNGQAPHPFKGTDWRPPPVVGSFSDGAWKLNLADNTRYRIIARQDGTWRELKITGNTVPDLDHRYDAVEALVDRRAR